MNVMHLIKTINSFQTFGKSKNRPFEEIKSYIHLLTLTVPGRISHKN